MGKIKIAISIEKDLLSLIDSKVDNSLIRSRSQAIELYLNRGLKDEKIDTAFIMVSKNKQHCLLKKIHGITLLEKQVLFLKKHGLRNIFIITQHSSQINDIINESQNLDANIEILEFAASNNGEALISSKGSFTNNFIVMNGNIFLDFDLKNMINKHLKEDKLATIALMSSKETSRYGVAIMDGELVVDFEEKPKHGRSNIVNAGVYIFKKEVYELMTKSPIEVDLLPKLAKIKQLHGFFAMGDYLYFD